MTNSSFSNLNGFIFRQSYHIFYKFDEQIAFVSLILRISLNWHEMILSDRYFDFYWTVNNLYKVICLTSTTLATSPWLLTALSSSRYIVFTLLGAGAAYIQNNVFLGVDSDEVSTLERQVARYKMKVQERSVEQVTVRDIYSDSSGINRD